MSRRRVFLHVGTPKSGTTYLQTVIWRNRHALRRQGLTLPMAFHAHYTAARVLTGQTRRMRRTRFDTENVWPALVRATHAAPGDVLISHELLAPATPEQIADIYADLAPAEVHVIVTVRALDKQIPASWQEQVKAGLPTTFANFIHRITRPETGLGRWFDGTQNLTSLVDRWGAALPPSRVHLVTTPRTSADPTLLWRRYAGVLGVDAEACFADQPRRNESLSIGAAELMRRVNARHDQRFTDPEAYHWTRLLLATRTLTKYPGEKLLLPADAHDMVRAWSRRMLDDVGGRGFDVAGDLADAECADAPSQGRMPADVSREEIAAAGDWAIAELPVRAGVPDPAAVLAPDDNPDRIRRLLQTLENIRAEQEGRPPRPGPPLPSRVDRYKAAAKRRVRSIVRRES